MNFVEYLLQCPVEDDKDFIAGVRERLSHGELRFQVDIVSKWLAKQHGSGKEMLVLADNSVFFVVAYLAIMRSGNVPLLVETKINKEELADLMSSCKPVLSFVQKRSLDRAVHGLPSLTETDLRSILSGKDTDEDLRAQTSEEDLAAIVFTSGSTGTKKGVMVTHGNLIANTTSIIEALQLRDDDRMMVVMPFYYCYGASLMHTHLRTGGSIVIGQSIFLGSVLDEIDRFDCTGLAGVPSTFQIFDQPYRFPRPSLYYTEVHDPGRW